MDMYFGGKSAMQDYSLSLTSCKISTPIRKQYPINVPGADGEIDAAEGMYPARYEMRTVTASFAPLGRDHRPIVNKIINDLEGRTVEIVLPDDAEHYLTGTIHVLSAGGAPTPEITITARCLPWRYASQETVYQIPASNTEVPHILTNNGTREVVPTVVLSGDTTITLDGTTTTISPGSYMLTDLTIPGKGSITIGIKGGAAEIRYREAIL